MYVSMYIYNEENETKSVKTISNEISEKKMKRTKCRFKRDIKIQ